MFLFCILLQRRRMKAILVIVTLFFTVVAGNAQNLVPNPSFEDTLECPDFPGQVWRAQNWYTAASTPDYYNCCCNASHPVCGVPDNIFSSRYAPSGVAYCGMWTYARNNPPPDFQEKIGVELLNPLQIGTRYFFSMKVSSVSSKKNEAVNGAHNKLGMLLSTTKYDLIHLPPNGNYAHFYSDSIVTDTIGWVTINGSFIADSLYKFLTIGNFFDNDHVDTIRYWYINGNNELTAYYFVDDICLTTDSFGCDFSNIIAGECSLSSVYNVMHAGTNPLVFPNPFSSALYIDYKNVKLNSIVLFNSFGKCVYINNDLPLKGDLKIDAIDLPIGVYFIVIQNDFGVYSQKIIKTSN